MRFVAIDPGVQKCGVAYFLDGRLIDCAWIPWQDIPVLGFNESPGYGTRPYLVIEMPRIYPGSGQQKGDLNDLLNLAAVVGSCEALFIERRRFFPSQWKGQVPKTVMLTRIRSKLTLTEQDILASAKCPAGKRHNVVDSIGLGLWHLGRL